MRPRASRRLPQARLKIELDEIKPSSRKYPYIDFRPARPIGNEVLTVEHLSKTVDGVKVLDDISFIVNHDDKIALVGSNELAKTTLFKILAGEMEPDEGNFKWGITTSQAYFPQDNTAIFDCEDTIVDWLMPFSPEKDVTYVRGFLGRMLFAGDDGVKKYAFSPEEKSALPALPNDDSGYQCPALRRADKPSRYGIDHRAEQRAD